LLPTLRAKKAPLISSNGFPGLDDVQAVWSTSFLPDEPGRALAAYLRAEADGPVWTMAVDDQGGRANIAGFVDAFVSGGGALSNVGRTPLFTGNDQLPAVSHAGEGEWREGRVRLLRGSGGNQLRPQYAQSDARDLAVVRIPAS
jgi:branched-chain amino acid transport system substrate-binding protein